VGRLRSSVSSILASIDQITTAEYEAVLDAERADGKKRPTTGSGWRAASPPPSSTGEPALRRTRQTDAISHQGVEAVAGADGPSPAEAKAEAEPVPPKTPLQHGITHFGNKNYVTAHKYFVIAAKESPHDGVPLAWLAWTRHTAPGTDPDQDPSRNKKLLLRAIQLSPRAAECHYFLGEIYVSLGDDGRAYTCFERAVGLAPDHRDARRRLDELKSKYGKGKSKTGESKNIYGQARKEKPAKGGLFGRILKK
jgi:tetratricopeptide (TPR) repeat protein